MPAESSVALSRDKSFWGMATAQFLGAFNDNLFKQLVLLLCVSHAVKGGSDYQPYALAVFAIPFVAFSGFAGFLSDRNSKRTIVVLCKALEIVIMLSGMVAFLMGSLDPEKRLYFLFIVLFMMSTQSAFFGPSKYGVLPELFPKKDLPAANGFFQMTTFVAIIFGMAMAGYAQDELGENMLWVASLISVGIAVLGTICSLFVRKTAVAQPGLKFQPSAMFVSGDTVRMLRADTPLMIVLFTSTIFWFLGGIVQPAVNDLGVRQLHLSNTRTSLMAACMGVGIAIGCVLAGKLCNDRTRFKIVRAGAWGLSAALSLVVLFTLWDAVPGLDPPPKPVLELNVAAEDGAAVKVMAAVENESLIDALIPSAWKEGLCRMALIGLGIAAGLYIVPLQVFMQSRPPEAQKGRMIGTMNLANWIGIVLSAVLLGVANSLLEGMGISRVWLFVGLAFLVIPIAIFFNPEKRLGEDG